MNSRNKQIEALTKVLADTYTLYLKTQNFHWNVMGPMFRSLHLLFEEQYKELATAIDEIAERIRSLGAYAPGSFRNYLELTSIEEATAEIRAEDMLEALAKDQSTIRKTIGHTLSIASDLNDDVTMDLMVRRAQVHEKSEWMLRSSIG